MHLRFPFLRGLFALLALLLVVFNARATHIVGGEFSLTHVSSSTYRLGLTMYFDNISGSPGALDNQIKCYIWERATSRFMDSVVMAVTPGFELVPYTNPACASNNNTVSTRILRYARNIQLTAGRYNHPEGYYVVWERCCRNGAISNIIDPGDAGQTFYLAFPPVIMDGSAFRNSSPSLFRPLSDFACVNRPYVADFSGTDPDGDQLVYSLVTPFSGNGTSSLPGQYPQSVPALPAPYRPIMWENGFGLNRQIPGPQPLTINPSTGQLNVTPGFEGLFVFAVQCTELRNNKIIGTVRRDFQLLVKDCLFNPPPDLSISVPDSAGQPGTVVANYDTVRLKAGTGNACLPLTVNDSTDQQTISILAPAFTAGGFLQITSNTGITQRNRPFNTSLCVNSCAAFNNQRVQGLVKVWSRDNGCPLPLSDTSYFYLIVEPPTFGPPVATASVNNIQLSATDTTVLTVEGRSGLGFSISVRDSSNQVSVASSISPPLPAGGQLQLVSSAASGQALTNRYLLNLPCRGDTTQVYTITFIGSNRTCGGETKSDTVTVRARLRVGTVMPRLAVYDSLGRRLAYGDTLRARVGQPLLLLPEGFSSDSSLIRLLSTFTSPGGSFEYIGAQGPGLQRGRFRWVPVCDIVRGLPPGQSVTFPLMFRAETDFCSVTDADSLALTLVLADTAQGTVRLPNLVTANGDAFNSAFRFMDPAPVSNCQGGFELVEIYNRWGRRLFESRNPGFVWQPEAGRQGQFFYRLKYSGVVYRGWIDVVR